MKFIKNKYFAIPLTSFVIFIFVSFFILSAVIPDSVFVPEEETNGGWLPDKWRWLITSEQTPAATAMENTSEKVSTSECSETVYLCGIIPIKTVSLSVTDNIKVIPGGDCVGIALKTRGLLVVGIEGFESESEGEICPGKKAGIKKGDVIEKINDTPVNKIKDVQKIIESSGNEIICKGKSGNKEKIWTVTPATSKHNDEKRIGIWLRESVAGVGTLTFYHDGIFGALGHAIADADTGEEVIENGGVIHPARIIGVEKGEKGVPGALKGIFDGDEEGQITNNSPVGIFGAMPLPPEDCTPVALASRKEIHPGKAQIICNIGNGKKYYDAEIQKVFPSSTDTKSMVIRITDKELIEKTGGIVQGMSGSPIIQNGRIVGAVTHVFVNDPTRGYGIFIENMLAEAEKIK